jgi:electron transport complex protein RnfG
VLTVVSLVSALALAFTYSGTKEAIAQVEVKRTLAALKQVLPEFDNDPGAEKTLVEGDEETEIYPAKKDGQTVGTAIKTYTDKGFAERIWLMVGFDTDKKIINISVLKQKETPGLGTKMKEPKFRDQFKGKDPASFKMTVKKDGGEVDAISAATITSRAFCEAVDKAYRVLLKGGEK